MSKCRVTLPYEDMGQFKGKDCVNHMLQHLAGMDEHVDNSCKQRAEYLHHSLIIVHTECAGIFHTEEAGMPCGGWCNGADFTKVSKFQEIQGELSMHKQCVPGSFFLPPTNMSLGMRLGRVEARALALLLGCSHLQFLIACSMRSLGDLVTCTVCDVMIGGQTVGWYPTKNIEVFSLSKNLIL